MLPALNTIAVTPWPVSEITLVFLICSAIISDAGRYSSLVEHQLPKLRRRVRFPLSAFIAKEGTRVRRVFFINDFKEDFIMKIGFIGCGNMGSAMIGGILRQDFFQRGHHCFQPYPEGKARSEKSRRCHHSG